MLYSQGSPGGSPETLNNIQFSPCTRSYKQGLRFTLHRANLQQIYDFVVGKLDEGDLVLRLSLQEDWFPFDIKTKCARLQNREKLVGSVTIRYIFEIDWWVEGSPRIGYSWLRPLWLLRSGLFFLSSKYTQDHRHSPSFRGRRRGRRFSHLSE